MTEHRCIECGYLTYRREATGEFKEVERSGSGTLPQPFPYVFPLCFVRSIDLQSEYKLKDQGSTKEFHDRQKQEISEVVSKPRECNDFTKWQQGFTPKEHREMLDRGRERRWHVFEIILILCGNAVVGLIVWLVSNSAAK